MLEATARTSALFALLALLVAAPAGAITQDFSGYPAGTVAAGIKPQGGFEPGFLFPDFQLIVHNNAGPQSALIFDSSNPTGGDTDLGTPNETCPGGGPGIGQGGEVGQPGENCTPMGNLIIIAENLVDQNSDDIADDPDDDADGGHLVFDFEAGFVPISVTLVDIDNETAFVEVHGDTAFVQVDATDLGDNSVQTLDLQGLGALNMLVINFSSSGAIAEIQYDVAPTAVEAESWGEVKSRHR